MKGIRRSLGCAVCAIAIVPVGPALRACAQTAATGPSFEVATVKPVDPSYRFDGTRFGPHISPAGASYWYLTVANLVMYAYELQPWQVTGPEWTNADRFDIEAKFPEGADKKDAPRMMQALLKDRFQLAFHIEKRQLQGYALVVGKQGEKLRPSPPDPVTPETGAPSRPGDTDAGEEPAKLKIITTADGSSKIDMGKRGTQSITFDEEHGALHYEISKITMEELAGRLGNCLGSGIHKVADETGIEGNYQVAFDCPSPVAHATPLNADGTLPSEPEGNYVLTRSLDALGLRLEKRNVPMDVYVIDRADRPSEN